MHKNLKNRLPPFRPILSVIGTHPYKLAIYLVPIWSNITQNDFTVQDFFDFVHETSTQDSDLYMASLGVDAFRTNIQLDQTDICVKKLFQDLKAFDKGRLSTRKTIIFGISLILVLNHYLINFIHLRLLLRIYLKEMFSLSCRFWEVICFKFKRNF